MTTKFNAALSALVVGINQYASPDVPTLKGAVPDANAMQTFLEKDLNVPSSRIRNLRNTEATRTAIIAAFHDLQNDPSIKPGDPILIFYAGHGGETKAPTGWEAGGPSIQMLLPHDFRTTVNGHYVHGIPDRTVGALLDDLAREKGDNIAVIFDCCHSGSGTRTDSNDPTRLSRGAEIPNNVPPDLDHHLWHIAHTARGMSVAAGFLQSGLRSHVLLAACGAGEEAHERNERGIFTKAFLEKLRSVGVENITYSQILHELRGLDGFKQNPQCEGYHQDRIIFTSKTISQGPVFYRVYKNDGGYTMDAGTAQGITNGATFTVYKDRDLTLTTSPLGTLVVLEAREFNATLSIPGGAVSFVLNGPGFALETQVGTEDCLRISMDQNLVGLFEALAHMQNSGAHQRIVLVTKDEADMDIVVEDDRVVFNVLDHRVTQHGLTRLPFSVSRDAEDIYAVVRAAAHYHWHLRRSNERKGLQNKVLVEFKKVEYSEDLDDDGYQVPEAVGPDLNKDSIVDLTIVEGSMYGIKIINTSNRALYPALFFFDNSDLSIEPYYQISPTDGQFTVDPPLQPKGSLAIGYGSGGSGPFEYGIRDGQDVDVGFLKLFLSTQPVDLSSVLQGTPFEPENRGMGTAKVRSPVPTWDSIIVTVVQRRSGSL